MDIPVIKASGIYLQQSFSEQSNSYIRKEFSVSEDEALISGIWFNTLAREGLVITDKSILWRGVSIRRKGDEKFSAKVEYYTGNTAQIKVTCEDVDHKFFISGLEMEACNKLCFLIGALSNKENFSLEELSPFVKPYSPAISVLHTPVDAIRNFFSSLNQTIDSVQENLNSKFQQMKQKSEEKKSQKKNSDQKNESQTEESKSGKEENTQSSQPKSESRQENKAEEPIVTTVPKKSLGEKISYLILAILDFIATSIFIAMIIFTLKPNLLSQFAKDGESFVPNEYSQWIETIGDYTFKIELKASHKAPALLNMILGIGLIAYSILKIIVLAFSKNGVRKIISFLALAMMIVAAIFLPEISFGLFLIFAAMIYLIFEFSCGISGKAVFKRFLGVILISLLAYGLLHLFLNETIITAFKMIGNELRLPAIKWF